MILATQNKGVAKTPEMRLEHYTTVDFKRGHYQSGRKISNM